MCNIFLCLIFAYFVNCLGNGIKNGIIQNYTNFQFSGIFEGRNGVIWYNNNNKKNGHRIILVNPMYLIDKLKNVNEVKLTNNQIHIRRKRPNLLHKLLNNLI